MATPRTQDCTSAEPRSRRNQAQEFLEVAELVANERDPNLEYSGVAASLAVLAGIAASDAACCHVLKERSRSQNHRDAITLIEKINPGGSEAGASLRVLIDLKDTAHYGFIRVSSDQLKRALRKARDVLEFADATLSR